MFVVCVTFEIKPEALGDFMSAMLKQAGISLELESGCHQFDVSRSVEAATGVFLYEVYSDRAAFDAHLSSQHFKSFDSMVQEMIVSKTVASFVREFPLADGQMA